MPLQQIAVLSQSKTRINHSGMDMAQGGECVVMMDTDQGKNERGDVPQNVDNVNDNINDITESVIDGCDPASGADITYNEHDDSNDIDMVTSHIEADTVIIGDTNSDFTSDGTDRQIGDGTECHVQIVSNDTSNNTCSTQKEKGINTRTGKSTKKEKFAPVKKKDSNTQETLHPNSPTPISAERCDSSMSNVDVCRICQCDTCEIQKESPLVAPCLCAGSLKFVHQACLQKWIKSSNKMSCELCHFDYQMTRKTKPFREWERLDMTPAERRKVVCSVTFHVIAITCVVWSLYVLIDRTTEEVEAGSLQWPFWTKLIVVAIGFTGGVVFMYVQCKLYLTLCKKWRTYNKVILVSSISETTRDKANHEGILKITEKQAQLEEERRTDFGVFNIVQESESF